MYVYAATLLYVKGTIRKCITIVQVSSMVLHNIRAERKEVPPLTDLSSRQ